MLMHRVRISEQIRSGLINSMADNGLTLDHNSFLRTISKPMSFTGDTRESVIIICKSIADTLTVSSHSDSLVIFLNLSRILLM